MTVPTRFGWVDAAAAAGVVLIWGLNFVAMKYGLQAFTPFQLGALRYVAAVLPLVLLVPRPRIAWRWLLLYGLCQGVGQFGLLFLALRLGMTAALASVLMQTQVFYTVIFSFVFLRERPGRQLQFALGLAALSLLCFGASVSGAQGTGVTPAGLLLNLGAAGMWAISNIVARKAQQSAAGAQGVDPLGFVVWSAAVPILPFMALSLSVDPPLSFSTLAEVGWRSWAAVLYLGWLATVLSYALWTGLLKRHPANKVAPLSLGVPVVGLLAGMSALGEQVSTLQWGGVLLTLAALVCVLLPLSRPR